MAWRGPANCKRALSRDKRAARRITITTFWFHKISAFLHRLVPHAIVLQFYIYEHYTHSSVFPLHKDVQLIEEIIEASVIQVLSK